MKYVLLATALGAALSISIASAAPPAAPPPPITGGVRAPRGFNYPHSDPYSAGSSPTWLRPYSMIDPGAGTARALGMQGNRYPLGGPSQPRIVWYW